MLGGGPPEGGLLLFNVKFNGNGNGNGNGWLVGFYRLVGRCHAPPGHAVNPAPRSGPAAGGWAFSRMRGNASQAMRLHPWGLLGNIHVA